MSADLMATTNVTTEEDNIIYGQAYALLADKFKGNKIDTADVMFLAVYGMQIVEKYPQLPGNRKKALVIRLAKRIVEDRKMSNKDRAAMLLAIDVLLPGAIDQLVAVANGQIDLGKIAKTCFPCLHRKPKTKQ